MIIVTVNVLPGLIRTVWNSFVGNIQGNSILYPKMCFAGCDVVVGACWNTWGSLEAIELPQ